MQCWKSSKNDKKLPIELAVLYQIRHRGTSSEIHTKHKTLPEVKGGGSASDYTEKRCENHVLGAVHSDQLPAEVKKQAIVAPQLLRARIA